MNREYNSRVSSKNSERLLKNWKIRRDYFFCSTLYIRAYVHEFVMRCTVKHSLNQLHRQSLGGGG